jgi:predicted pyridoxine 5'-phosphate oxidase superfamily flavin-nucleotide-binding protein
LPPKRKSNRNLAREFHFLATANHYAKATAAVFVAEVIKQIAEWPAYKKSGLDFPIIA